MSKTRRRRYRGIDVRMRRLARGVRDEGCAGACGILPRAVAVTPALIWVRCVVQREESRSSFHEPCIAKWSCPVLVARQPSGQKRRCSAGHICCTQLVDVAPGRFPEPTAVAAPPDLLLAKFRHALCRSCAPHVSCRSLVLLELVQVGQLCLASSQRFHCSQ